MAKCELLGSRAIKPLEDPDRSHVFRFALTVLLVGRRRGARVPNTNASVGRGAIFKPTKTMTRSERRTTNGVRHHVVNNRVYARGGDAVRHVRGNQQISLAFRAKRSTTTWRPPWNGDEARVRGHVPSATSHDHVVRGEKCATTGEQPIRPGARAQRQAETVGQRVFVY